MTAPVPLSKRSRQDLVPLPIAKACALISAYETIFFSSDTERVKAMAIWMFACEKCSGQIDRCKPDLTSFGCMMCLTNRNGDNEAKKVWLALPEDRRQWVASLLQDAGYIFQ